MIGEISILNVLVTGPGTIGASLALACAVHGHCVTLLGRREASLASAQKLISRCASELEESALAPAEFDGWQGRITMTTRLQDVPTACEIAIEAINEELTAKQEIIAALEAHLQKDAVLASSTSGLPVDQIAANCVRASQFAVAHFANPPHLMPVVEVVPGSDTSPETILAIEAFVRSLNKTPVRLDRDVPGHLFNRIQFAMLRVHQFKLAATLQRELELAVLFRRIATLETGPEVIGTTVVADGRAYAVIGQDPEHGDGVGQLTCLEGTDSGVKALWI